MLTTIKGVYDQGEITLTEPAPVKTKTDVMVTFLSSEEKATSNGKQRITLGLLAGKIRLADDFNEPLDDLKDYM
jgi:Protein of unknown function (DUF2281)